MSVLEIRLFGDPELSFEGRPWRLPSPPKTIPLLAQLATRPGALLARANLAALLWPDDDESDARTNLRRHLHRLTGALPPVPDAAPWIVSTSATVGWNAGARARVDVVEFERLAADRRNALEAIEYYRGDFLQRHEGEEWIYGERERLRGIALGVMQEAASAARMRGEFEVATAIVQRMLAVEPWREDALRAQLAILSDTGDRQGALDAYDAFSARLKANLRVDPMPETIALRDAIASGIAVASLAVARESSLPFVGREREMQSLRGVWVAAVAQRGTTLFLSGEAGIGKSRLVAEFAANVEGRGGRSLVGTTSSPESVPYQPLVEALRRGLPYVSVRDVDPVWLSVAATVLPELHAAVPSLERPDRIDPAHAKTRLHEAFVRLFEHIARTRPLAVVFEDLHWAHAETIEAIELLARRAGALPLLVACTYRAESVGGAHPLGALRRTLVRERLAATIALSALTPDDVATLVRLAQGESALPSDLAEAIYRRSEGNALFASQLVRGFLESGELAEQIGGANDVMQAIVARFDRLEAHAREISTVASAIGRTFSAELVAEIGEWEYEAVLDALGELIDRHLVREASGSSFDYEFSHGLIADAIYARSQPAARAALHRRIAQALERSGDDREAYSAIARHWKLAGERQRAAEAYARAAHSALEVYARAEAIEDAMESLELGDGAGVRFRFDTMRALVKAEEHYAPVDRWKVHVDELETYAAQLDDEARYAALQARERYFAQTGERERQRAAIDAMLALACANGDTHGEAVALGLLGELFIGLGAFVEAEERFRAALAVARDLGDRLLLGRLRQKHVEMLMRLGNADLAGRELEEQRRFVGDSVSLEERLNLAWAESAVALALEEPGAIERVANQILELGARAGDIEVVAKAHWLLGGAADLKRETEKVRFHYGEAVRLFERLRQPQSLAATLINMGVHEIGEGMCDRAIDCYRRGADYARQAGSQNVLGFALANLADAEFILGNVDSAYAHANEAKDIALPTGDRRLQGLTSITLGRLLVARGEVEAGLEMMRQAIGFRQDMRNTEALAGDVCSIVEVLLTLPERREELARYAEQLENSQMVRSEITKYPSRAYLALAKAAYMLGDGPKADRFWKKGRTWLQQRMAALDPETAAALQALPWNRELVAASCLKP